MRAGGVRSHRDCPRIAWAVPFVPRGIAARRARCWPRRKSESLASDSFTLRCSFLGSSLVLLCRPSRGAIVRVALCRVRLVSRWCLSPFGDALVGACLVLGPIADWRRSRGGFAADGNARVGGLSLVLIADGDARVGACLSLVLVADWQRSVARKVRVGVSRATSAHCCAKCPVTATEPVRVSLRIRGRVTSCMPHRLWAPPAAPLRGRPARRRPWPAAHHAATLLLIY